MSSIAQQNMAAGLASREPYWEELTDVQKIERLRDELVSTIRRLSDAQRTIAVLTGHEHGRDGRIMVAAFGGAGETDRPRGYRYDVSSRLLSERERR